MVLGRTANNPAVLHISSEEGTTIIRPGEHCSKRFGEFMDRIQRIGVSLEPGLLEQLDEYAKKMKYPSRSEAIRDMVRDKLNLEKLKNPSEPAVGSITLIYGHHESGLSEKLTDFQHQHHDLIISTTHIHLDKENCMEILVCSGKAREIKELAEQIGAIKGVMHGSVSIAGMGKAKKGKRGHAHRH